MKMPRADRRGYSLAEILAVVTIVGILAAIIVPRIGGRSHAAKGHACAVNKGNIEVQSQLWYRNKGSWPAADLSDLAADKAYMPDGLPRCPVDGSEYLLDQSTGEVRGHSH